MDFVHPPWLFVCVDGVLAPRLLGRMYTSFARSIRLSGDEKVLEFGCGSGGLAQRLAVRLPRGDMTCVDICPPMLRIARRRLQRSANVEFIQGEIGEAGLAEHSFDLIVIHNALHDVPAMERQRIAAVLASLLKSGGKLRFREPTKQPHGVPADALRLLLRDAGFVEEKGAERSIFPIGAVYEATFVLRRREMAFGSPAARLASISA